MSFIWETIFSLIKTLLFERSIIQAKPTSLALFVFTILEHSIADFPVVITSSTIRTLESGGITNPRLNNNLSIFLSAKIVCVFNCLPISYPTTIPPKAGDKTISISLKLLLIFSVNEAHIISACLG